MVKLSLAEWKRSDGRKSIFEIVEGVMASIDPLREINELAVVQGKARIKLELPRQNQDWEFTLKGSVGAVTINVTLAEGMEENLAMLSMQKQIKQELQQNLILRLALFF